MIESLLTTWSIFALIIGLIIGSFLNCLIWRLYKDESLGGRSYCPKCRQQISWYDNIPLFSFVFLKGRCRHCHQKISWQYPLVELITALLFYVSFINLTKDAQLISSGYFFLAILRSWLLIATLVVIFVYDARWQLIPMKFIWPITAVFFILGILMNFGIINLLLAGIFFTSFFLIQYIITKKRGVGEGDIWLGLLLGIAFPDFQLIFLLIILAYFSGSLIGLGLMLFKGKNSQTKIALGPFLAFGAIITLIWGKQIVYWYLQLFF